MAITGAPGASPSRATASGVTRASSACPPEATSTSAAWRPRSSVIARTVPGIRLCTLIASGSRDASITSRAGTRTRTRAPSARSSNGTQIGAAMPSSRVSRLAAS